MTYICLRCGDACPLFGVRRNSSIFGKLYPYKYSWEQHVSHVPLGRLSWHQLVEQLRVGDLLFIRVPVWPFTEVALATMSWVNHVGVVVAMDGPDPLLAESAVPVSRMTRLSRFLKRAESRRVAVSRLPEPLTAAQQGALHAAAHKRLGMRYDTGFNLHSPRQFCSKYVREVLAEATGHHLGEVETFRTMLERNPQGRLGFWRLWFLGRIPWQRETVTPAAILRSTGLRLIVDALVDDGAAARSA